MIAEQFAEQAPGAGLAAASGKGLGQVEADVQADRQDQQVGREGNPPAPFLQLALVEPEGEQVAHQPGGDRRDALRYDLPAGVGAALVRRCRLEDVGGRRPGLAAPGQALQQAGQHQQQRRGRADAVVAGEHRDAAGAQRHQEQGKEHRRLAPGAVGVGADKDRAEGADDEADAERGDRQEQADEGAVGGEESPSDHHREGGIDPEVEEFHGVAEDHGKDAAAAGRIGGRRGTGGGAHGEGPLGVTTETLRPGAERRAAAGFSQPAAGASRGSDRASLRRSCRCATARYRRSAARPVAGRSACRRP